LNKLSHEGGSSCEDKGFAAIYFTVFAKAYKSALILYKLIFLKKNFNNIIRFIF